MAPNPRGLSRQPERWEQAAVEASDGGDVVAGEGEDEEVASPGAGTGRAVYMGNESGLTIRSRRHEVIKLARRTA